MKSPYSPTFYLLKTNQVLVLAYTNKKFEQNHELFCRRHFFLNLSYTYLSIFTYYKEQ